MQTIGKIFFLCIFLGGVAGFVFVILGSFGALPDSTYESFYQVEESLSTRLGMGASSPAFKQFEGHWKVKITPVAAASDISTCISAEGYVLSHDANMEGALHSYNPFTTTVLSLTINQNGSAAGALKRGVQDSGSFTAIFNNGTGSGNWSDDINCSGTIVFTKILPSI